MAHIQSIPITLVKFKKEFYTRTESKSPAKVQEYSKSIEDGAFPGSVTRSLLGLRVGQDLAYWPNPAN